MLPLVPAVGPPTIPADVVVPTIAMIVSEKLIALPLVRNTFFAFRYGLSGWSDPAAETSKPQPRGGRAA